ncbi:MAG: glycosyl transferase family 36, partial [Xanthomonadales bacterium]|nr:glycosyl transferase family 36 [Xanthomonadales bacterium]
PCAAMQQSIELADGAETDIVFMLGQGADLKTSQALIARYRDADIEALLKQASDRWDDMLHKVQVSTPDRRMDLLLNRWLPYQVLSCRVNARTAFFQASGAWGFRDQLQDVMALCLTQPQVTRTHLLRCAAHQFVEGDVLHWWLPPGGAGVRTRIVDDRLWLPYAVAHYVTVTGDTDILDEDIAFLEAPQLKPEQVDSFSAPKTSAQTGSLFEHCARALEVSLSTGEHGLPLFGTGDWNDGMNRVGKDGRGESVWMGWFLHTALTDFSPFADSRGEHERAKSWRDHAAALAHALDQHAWDGDWWKRGWYDDGSELGSANNDECKIDTIAQSWAVMSGAADGQRAARAMQSVERMAVDHDARLIALFTPGFDDSPKDPGYIKGYPPGLRENGGQYTHGVIWSVIAFALLRDGDKASELFNLLNPISHAQDAASVARYQSEPYVTCGDVYTAPGHVGRGGWSWYSGSAGWLYRAALEWILGLRVRGTQLHLVPCIPKNWPGFAIEFRHLSARYQITVENPNQVYCGIVRAELDGEPLAPPAHAIDLVDDGATHKVHITLG